MLAQKELANKTCRKLVGPTWYQCHRWHYLNGVFETRVQIAGRSGDTCLKKHKLEFFSLIFAIVHFFAGPYSYFMTPRVPPPPPKAHPLHNLHDYMPMVLQHIYSFVLTFELGGTILQFVMNSYSRTYAGKYKMAAILMLVANTLLLLDLLPQVVETSARIGGAVRYRNVKTSDINGNSGVMSNVARSEFVEFAAICTSGKVRDSV
ncbi:hypothetical protein D9756_010617 [Leucocoprinus leucothites]|uniref:Uncharacterized protein n=1 Tax=Leucocoprinus leucothites TaxID=201217 RepID=A0A8H5CTQ3_9AGAR|nr:hypothetical protein D9756_010617 [Leucoagaricus leucothites]